MALGRGNLRRGQAGPTPSEVCAGGTTTWPFFRVGGPLVTLIPDSSNQSLGSIQTLDYCTRQRGLSQSVGKPMKRGKMITRSHTLHTERLQGAIERFVANVICRQSNPPQQVASRATKASILPVTGARFDPVLKLLDRFPQHVDNLCKGPEFQTSDSSCYQCKLHTFAGPASSRSPATVLHYASSLQANRRGSWMRSACHTASTTDPQRPS